MSARAMVWRHLFDEGIGARAAIDGDERAVANTLEVAAAPARNGTGPHRP
jgi:hypothetical protein